PVQLIGYDGMIHGFFTMSGTIDRGETAVQQSAAALRNVFDLDAPIKKYMLSKLPPERNRSVYNDDQQRGIAPSRSR
ncbi:MAG: hypothetical protein JW793_03455, partial [Acidobacteria bacterium]|nr:hypothetical protein [Acidobacteriota bacterium]